MAVRTAFRNVAGNSAVMETLSMPPEDEMVTLYSVDGDEISLIHYCPTKNQPHMQAKAPSGEVRELVFEFRDARNLPSTDTGHEHKLVLQFEDRNHITERWTWRRNGADTEMIYRFVRKQG